MTSAPLNSEELDTIRADDAYAGENLQECPRAWQHRRQLLGHIAALEEVHDSHKALVRRLDVVLNGEDGAAPQASLCDIVGQIERLVRGGSDGR